MSLTSATLVTVQTVVLLVLCLLVLYPVYAYSRNVMHTGGVLALSVALFLFTVSSVVKHVGYVLIGEAIHLATDLCLLAAVWLFAREFVRTDGGFDRATTSTAPGGSETGDAGFAEDASTDRGDRRAGE